MSSFVMRYTMKNGTADAISPANIAAAAAYPAQRTDTGMLSELLTF
ncbi:MAG: hypothetical protein J6O50_12635 [Ruminiclostridium sp.]|nr:hypothetical protein [Ruminiclostridium sp.]